MDTTGAGASFGALKGCVLYEDIEQDGEERKVALGCGYPKVSFV
jgi:hypothetical protein